MSTRTKVAGAALALLAPVLAVAGTTTASQADTASDLTAKFQSYGNTSGQWSGGDGTQSQKLSDGRVLWFFSDTYHGTVTNGVRRPFSNSFINNSMVIQNASGALVDTVERRVNGAPASLVPPANAGEYLWGGGQTVANQAVYKFYQRTATTGSGDLDFMSKGVELVRMPIGTITDPGSYSKVVLPPAVADCGNSTSNRACTLWGVDLLDQGGYTYIYGVDVANDGEKYLKVARVPLGDFTASGWRFWNGSDWVTGAGNALRLMRGVQEGFSVAPVGGRLVLLTQDSGSGSTGLTADMYAYSSSTPQGFTRASRSHLYATPETTVDGGRLTYEYRIVEHLTSGNTIVASYNQNSLYSDNACNKDSSWTASVYRPRFVTLTVPTTATGGADRAPTAAVPSPWTLTPPAYCKDSTTAIPTPRTPAAAALSGARINFTWANPTTGQWHYDMQYRDVTAGQGWEPTTPPSPDNRTRTGFFFAPSPNKWELGALHHNHVYEFRVRAGAWTGRTSGWVTARATAKLNTPTGVKVTKPATNTCRVTWTDGQPGVLWQVHERNTSSGATRTLGYYSSRTVDIGKPVAGKAYDYKVRAANDKAPGAWSSVARCS